MSDNILYSEGGKSPFGSASPVLIVGIVIFVLPFFNSVVGWNIPGWFSGVGVFVILVGSLLSMIKMGK